MTQHAFVASGTTWRCLDCGRKTSSDGFDAAAQEHCDKFPLQTQPEQSEGVVESYAGYTSRSSSGQDTGSSSQEQEFESPAGYKYEILEEKEFKVERPKPDFDKILRQTLKQYEDQMLKDIQRSSPLLKLISGS